MTARDFQEHFDEKIDKEIATAAMIDLNMIFIFLFYKVKRLTLILLLIFLQKHCPNCP